MGNQGTEQFGNQGLKWMYIYLRALFRRHGVCDYFDFPRMQHGIYVTTAMGFYGVTVKDLDFIEIK